MKLDDLLENWARWRVAREDKGKGLGYAACRLGVLMGGGGGAGGRISLPYGIDADSACAHTDAAVCRLPKPRQRVIKEEYCRIGTRSAKAAGLKLKEKSYEAILSLARKELKQQPEIKKLMQE